jgi:hypothetical protein
LLIEEPHERFAAAALIGDVARAHDGLADDSPGFEGLFQKIARCSGVFEDDVIMKRKRLTLWRVGLWIHS